MTTNQRLRTSMRQHWQDGKRPPEFHDAVHSDCPDATLAQFNEAADDVWRELQAEGRA